MEINPIGFTPHERGMLERIEHYNKQLFKSTLLKKELKDLVNDPVAMDAMYVALANNMPGGGLDNVTTLREQLRQKNAQATLNAMLHVAKVLQSYGYGPE